MKRTLWPNEGTHLLVCSHAFSCDARNPLCDAFQLLFHHSNPACAPTRSEALTVQTKAFEETNKNHRPVRLHLISLLTQYKNNKQRQTITVLYTACSSWEASSPSARLERSKRRRIAKFSKQRSGKQLQRTMGSICVGQSCHVGSEGSSTHIHTNTERGKYRNVRRRCPNSLLSVKVQSSYAKNVCNLSLYKNPFFNNEERHHLFNRQKWPESHPLAFYWLKRLRLEFGGRRKWK